MATKINGSTINLVANAVSVVSANLTSSTVRISTTTNIYFAFGSAPVANSSCAIMTTGTEIFKITPPTKLAITQVSVAGVVSVTGTAG